MPKSVYTPEELDALRVRFLEECARRRVRPDEPAAEDIAVEIFHADDDIARLLSPVMKAA